MLSLPCVIEKLRGSSQHHPGKSERKTLSKIIRSPIRRWPALTMIETDERQCDLGAGEGTCGEQDTQGPMLYCVGHRETVLKGELRCSWGWARTQAYKPVHAPGCSSFANQKLRGREYTKGTGGPDPTWLPSTGQSRAENSGRNSCKSVAGLGLEGRSWMPEICSSQPEPFTDRRTQTPPVDYISGRVAVPGPGVSWCIQFLRENKKKAMGQTLPATQFFGSRLTKQSRANRDMCKTLSSLLKSCLTFSSCPSRLGIIWHQLL